MNYRLDSDGWASIQFNADDLNENIGFFGRNTDALGDLLRAILHVSTGGPFANVLFDGEPEEWQLRIKQTIPASTNAKVFGFAAENGFGRTMPTDDAATFVFECSIDELATAIAASARSLLNSYGVKGYAATWGGAAGFPLRALTALEAALNCEIPLGRDPLL